MFTDAKEDDPLVATSWATSALAIGLAMGGQSGMPPTVARWGL
jgi:hypothetical protein